MKLNREIMLVIPSILFFAFAQTLNAEPSTVPLASKTPRHPLKIAGICTRGFEDAKLAEASIEFDDPKAEESCDQRSLCGFKIAADIPCDDRLPGEGYESDMVSQYDLDNNGKVECADYFAWKHWLADQYRKGNRKNRGDTLYVAECEQAHNNTLDGSGPTRKISDMWSLSRARPLGLAVTSQTLRVSNEL